MKLTYRGVQYDYNPPSVQVNTTEDTGKFRGVDIRFRSASKHFIQQPNLDLVYRGVPYSTHNHKAQTAAAVSENVAGSLGQGPSSVNGTYDKARMMMMNHHRSVKRRQQSMLSRLALEVGLPANAPNYWNHIQGKVHPSFWATYDRSRAAAS